MTDDLATISIQDAIGHRLPRDVAISPDGTRIVFSLGWASKEEEYPVADLWIAALDGSGARRLTSGDSNDVQPCWSPDGGAIAFISDRETRELTDDDAGQKGAGALYLIAPDGGEAVRLTTLGGAAADPKWSPDGRRISIKVTDADTDDDKRRKKERDDVKVHREREKLDRLCVVDVPAGPFGGEVTPVEPSRVLHGDWHLWEHAWSPDGSRCAVTVARHTGWDESFDGLRLGLLPADGGEPALVGGERGVYRTPASLAWSPDGRKLAFLGGFDLARDAGEAIFVIDAADPSTAAIVFNDEEGSLLSLAWPLPERLAVFRLRGTHATLWTLPADGSGAPEIATGGLPGERGTVEAGWAPSLVAGALDRAAEHVALAWSDATYPPEVWGGEIGAAPRQLTRFNARLTERRLGRTELLRWTSDEHEIEGQLIYPVDYAPGRRYPTILHIHGGPSWAWDDHFYASWHDWGQLLAGRGYAVLLPNPRGSTGRGWRFQIANHDDWMGGDYRDSQAGIDALIERGIADPQRLGIGGWSYGGFTTAWVLTQTNRYKAAVLGAGVTNRASMHGTTDIIRWHGSWLTVEFAESPDEFWRHSPLRYIGQVTTPTLVLHGENDLRVPVSQGWEYYNALRAMGVPTQMVVYPREPHGIEERQHQRDLLERVVAWFDQYVRDAGCGIRDA
jgi:dipeptidyl aminopeptidase/acylaminoacyl peptidase